MLLRAPLWDVPQKPGRKERVRARQQWDTPSITSELHQELWLRTPFFTLWDTGVLASRCPIGAELKDDALSGVCVGRKTAKKSRLAGLHH